VHAIAADQVTIVQVHGFLEMIHAQAVLRAHGPRQRIRGARGPQRVVAGEQGEHAIAHPVNARIPNMDQMGTPAAQNQCAQSAGHAIQGRVGSPDGIQPAIHGIGGRGADSRHSQRGRQVQAGLYEAPDGQLRGYAASLGPAHAIRQCSHQADS
jgi:hypothetical protein